MKGLFLLADGFEDVEALAPRDLLVRAGVEVHTASISNELLVTTSHKIKLYADHLVSEIKEDDYDFIVLPGGGRGTQNLLNSEAVLSLVKKFNDNHKLVCAICAAPMVLSKAGLLHNKKFTCYKGCEEGLDGLFTGEEVVKDDNIITARSMLYSIPFGLAIIELLLGSTVKEKIYHQIAGLR